MENTKARRDELERNLKAARARIDAASEDRSVDLLVVSKTYPATDVEILNDLGQKSFGENRDQEAKRKVDECNSSRVIRWHMIGQLQSNKLNSIARWADVVESLDRIDLIAPLERAATLANRTLEVLIQINLDPQDAPHRGGLSPHAVPEFLEELEKAPHLLLGGVMGVGPNPDLGANLAAAFERLANVSAEIVISHPDATAISAGMSGDLEQAIKAGATQVRLGSAILGQRQSVG
jgi:pyridoxal phosphate enzyme (YggS family)